MGVDQAVKEVVDPIKSKVKKTVSVNKEAWSCQEEEESIIVRRKSLDYCYLHIPMLTTKLKYRVCGVCIAETGDCMQVWRS